MTAIIGSAPMVLPRRSGAHSGDHSDTASGIVVFVLIGTGEAAQHLGVSPRRLRALIAEDRVRARWVGRQWLVDEADLLSVLVRPPVRPLGPRLSSALLAALSGQEPSGLSSGERRRLRAHLDRLAGEDEPAPLLSAWLRGRAEVARLHTPASEIPAVAADPRLLASGISDPRTNLSSGHEFEGWVRREDLAGVCKDHLLVRPAAQRVHRQHLVAHHRCPPAAASAAGLGHRRPRRLGPDAPRERRGAPADRRGAGLSSPRPPSRSGATFGEHARCSGRLAHDRAGQSNVHAPCGVVGETGPHSPSGALMPSDRRPARTARRRPRLRPVALLAALVAVGASGCSLLSFEADSGASTQTLADGSGFLVAAPTNFFPEAIVSGRLALIGDDCMGLEGLPGERGDVLAFPHGTRASDDGRAIVLPDGLQITVGDQITGGGGYTTLSERPDAFDRWPDAPSGCAKATNLASIYDVKISDPLQG